LKARDRGALTLRGEEWVWGRRTYVMAIVNVTPDSFSGDGTGDDVAAAVARGLEAAEAGADLLDVGGESTRPGASPVDATAEIERVVPVVAALHAATRLPISVDTSKAAVARAALESGAEMVNDVWGLRRDPELATVVAEAGVPIVLMHNRSDPSHVSRSDIVGGHYVGIDYTDVVVDVAKELGLSIDLAREAGIPEGHIVLDPGLGFGKTVAQNLLLVDRLDELTGLGFPLLVGPSRKSFIGATLELPPEDRLEGTAATVAIAIARGADIVRVHDAEAMVRVARMTDAIVRRG
jgi:dihydropteroate synthase